MQLVYLGKHVQNRPSSLKIVSCKMCQSTKLSFKFTFIKFQLFRKYFKNTKGVLIFQNRISNIKLLKFHTNRDNMTYLEKCDFQRKLICQIWDFHWIHDVEMSPKVVLDPNSESKLAPSLAVKNGQRTVERPRERAALPCPFMCRHRYALVAVKPGPEVSTPSELT